jgi:hypothetical protein
MFQQRKFFTVIFISIFFTFSFKQTEPWQSKQLIEPRDLAFKIEDSKSDQPLILSVGPGAVIKGSVDIGSASVSKNLEKLKQVLLSEKKDRAIVIYCGCCPFEHCPNIRPAFSLLNEMKFTNHRLLNIQHNIKIDWLDKNYPSIKR